MTYIRTTEPSLEREREKIPGEETFEAHGKNPDIDTATFPEDVWNGGSDYTGFPTGAAETMEIFSSSANDTGAGTGARTITIYNLMDDTGASMPDVTVTLNGTTPVSLGVQTYYRGGTVMKIRTAGSTGANQGAITLRHTTTTANIFAVMPTLANETAIAARTIPLGKTYRVGDTSFQMARANGSPGSATTSFRYRPHGEVFRSKLSPEISHANSFVRRECCYDTYEARTDIKMRVDEVSDNNTIVTADFGGVLENA